jgi:hypothetical protein
MGLERERDSLSLLKVGSHNKHTDSLRTGAQRLESQAVRFLLFLVSRGGGKVHFSEASAFLSSGGTMLKERKKEEDDDEEEEEVRAAGMRRATTSAAVSVEGAGGEVLE